MSSKPKLPISSNQSRCCCLKICIIFLIVVEMGLGVAAIVTGMLMMEYDDIGYDNAKGCFIYESGTSAWYRSYHWNLRQYSNEVCTSITETVGNHFQMPITLGGVVFFSTGILQLATSDKPICGLAFSIIALLFVMQPTITITINAFNYVYIYGLCIEFLLIPYAAIIYCLQRYQLKKVTSSPLPENTNVVV